MGEPSTFVIAITPFDDDERLDEGALRAHLRRLAAAGIGVYVGGGGSGEAYSLSPAEVRRVMEIAGEELRGRVPVRAMGVEPRSAQEMIEFGRVVADVGLDAMQVYSLDMGHGHLPRPEEVDRYFSDILEETAVPVVLSTHQSVGYQVPVETIGRLTQRYPHVVGVNCTNPDLGYLIDLLDVVGPATAVHVGGPMQALSALALGASGYLSSEGNLAPRLCTAVIERYAAGDLVGSHDAYGRVMRLFVATSRLGGIRATKAALGMLGLPGGRPRRPRLPLTDPAALLELRRVVDSLGIAATEGAPG